MAFTSVFHCAAVALVLSQVLLSALAAVPVDRSYHYRHAPRLTCEQAFRQCDFRFDGYSGIPTFYLSPGYPDQAISSAVVSKDYSETLGVLNSNNIVPEFILNGAATPITKFANPRFTPTHFKPFTIYDNKSGVGHQTLQGNQAQTADGKCIRVYFTSYQLLDRYSGNVIDNKNNVPRSANKCVVFKVKNPYYN